MRVAAGDDELVLARRTVLGDALVERVGTFSVGVGALGALGAPDGAYNTSVPAALAGLAANSAFRVLEGTLFATGANLGLGGEAESANAACLAPAFAAEFGAKRSHRLTASKAGVSGSGARSAGMGEISFGESANLALAAFSLAFSARIGASRAPEAFVRVHNIVHVALGAGAARVTFNVTFVLGNSEGTLGTCEATDFAHGRAKTFGVLFAVGAAVGVAASRAVGAEAFVSYAAVVVFVVLAVDRGTRGALNLHVVSVPVLRSMVGSGFDEDLDATLEFINTNVRGLNDVGLLYGTKFVELHVVNLVRKCSTVLRVEFGVLASGYRALVLIVNQTTAATNIAELALLGGGDDLVLRVNNAKAHEIVHFLLGIVYGPPLLVVLGIVFVVEVGHLKRELALIVEEWDVNRALGGNFAVRAILLLIAVYHMPRHVPLVLLDLAPAVDGNIPSVPVTSLIHSDAVKTQNWGINVVHKCIRVE